MHKEISMNPSDNPSQVKLLFALSRGMILISLLIAVIVSTLVLANYYQIQKADVLNSSGLHLLKEQLKDNKADELLRNDVRSVHLLARKAYFNSLWQVRTGGYIILISLAIFSLSLKIFYSVKRKLPDPKAYPETPEFLNFSQSIQRTIMATGGVLFASGLVVSFLTTTNIPSNLGSDSLLKLDASIDLTQYWPNFRGPAGNGLASTTEAPMEWDGASGKNILWKAPIPRTGYSSPIVVADKVFITGGDASTREVFCYHAESGELLWQQIAPNMLPPDSEFDFDFVDPETGFAAPTMATDGKRVVAIFATGDLVCYTVNGERAWGRNLGILDNHYAHSSSLIMYGNLCLVQYDSFENPRLFAVDISNGAIVWEKPRQTISWSSPICVNTGSRMELILADSKFVTSYNPLTGDEYWSVECLSGEVGPSPAYADGFVFVANEYANSSGLKINANDSVNPIEITWQSYDGLPNTSSPVARDGLLLLATSGGMVTMVNSLTGEAIWEAYLGVGFYSSAVIVQDRVYLMDLGGKMHIFKFASSYTPLSVSELGEHSSCTPAFVKDKIYIRGEQHLFCIGEVSS